MNFLKGEINSNCKDTKPNKLLIKDKPTDLNPINTSDVNSDDPSEQGDVNAHKKGQNRVQLKIAFIFEKEAKIKKYITELEQDVQNIGFDLFSKHLLLSKCKKIVQVGESKLQNPDLQLIKEEILGLEQKLTQVQQLKVVSAKELEKISQRRKEITTIISSNNDQDQLKGWMNNRILELHQMDMNRGFQMAQFQIKQRDNYISYLKDQLAQRTKQLMEKLSNNTSAPDENENYNSLHNIEESITTHLPNLSPLPDAEHTIRMPYRQNKYALLKISRASPELNIASSKYANYASKAQMLSKSKIKQISVKCISELSGNIAKSDEKSRNSVISRHKGNYTDKFIKRRKLYHMTADRKPTNYNLSISLSNK